MSAMWTQIQGYIEGPHEASAVKQRFESGELGAGTMSWQSGESGWKSLGRRWGRSTGRSTWGWLFLGVLLAASIVLLGWSPFRYANVPVYEQSGVQLVRGGALLAGVLGLIGLLYVVVVSMRHRKLVPSALYVLVLVSLAIGFAVSQQRLHANALDAVQKLPNARVTVSEGGNRIDVEGEIGIRLLHDLKQARLENPGANLLVMNSPGGLLDEAESVGRWARESGIAVRIEQECASACVLVWAAASERQMWPLARVGLHRVSSELMLPASALHASLEKADAHYRKLLGEAGFSEDLIRSQQSTAPDDMFWLSAARLVDDGVKLTGIDEAGRSVDDSGLRWSSLVISNGEDQAMGQLLAVVGENLPAIADSYAEKLYWADKNENRALFRIHAGEMFKEIRREALHRASDKAVIDWSIPLEELYAEAVQSQNVGQCKALLGDVRAMDTELEKALDESFLSRLGVLVGSLSESDVARTVSPEQVFQNGDLYAQTMRQAYTKLAYDYGSRFEQWSPMQRCAFTVAVHKQMGRLPEQKHAALIRHMDLL